VCLRNNAGAGTEFKPWHAKAYRTDWRIGAPNAGQAPGVGQKGSEEVSLVEAD